MMDSAPQEGARTVFKISIPHTYAQAFDYYADEQKPKPQIGARVLVPFRHQKKLGIVIAQAFSERVASTIKTIAEIIDETPILSANMLGFYQWISDYYQAPLSEVLALALPKKYRDGGLHQLPMTLAYRRVLSRQEAYQRLATHALRQRQLVDVFINEMPVGKTELQRLGYRSNHIQRLLEQQIIVECHQRDRAILTYGHAEQACLLNDEQAQVVSEIAADLSKYHAYLLQGVTGSGKTEVYLQIITRVLSQGKQVLVLVPEIGLTPQLLSRFTTRIASPMVVIHSKLNDSERQQAWYAASTAEAQLVIGTRAAIFTPLPQLGLIVIDEEHDLSFKQMEGVRYSARDAALMRAYLSNTPIILGSATPSLESLYNCELKKVRRLRLEKRALNDDPLHYQILDVRSQPLHHGLSQPALDAIAWHLKNNNQVLVFINRRGFSPVLLCHQCGWMMDCRACDSHMTLHKAIGKLICHHCGLQVAMPTSCQRCHSQELIPVGAGTQRVHEFLSSYFPETTVVRIDRDEVGKKHAFDHHLERIARGDSQLIIGTQMLAKGHHFPRLTLVLVVDADQGLYQQDFRSLERLGQLLIQVAGRAGRAEFPGQVIIQTHEPQHALLNILIQQGYDAFATQLLMLRQQAAMPPYHFLAMIRAQGKTVASVMAFMQAIKGELLRQDVFVLGPAPAPLARKADQHRFQLLLKSSSRKQLRFALQMLRDWLASREKKFAVRWNIDIDPLDLS